MKDSDQEATEESGGIIESADELPSSSKIFDDIDSDEIDTEFENVNYDNVNDPFEYGTDEGDAKETDS